VVEQVELLDGDAFFLHDPGRSVQQPLRVRLSLVAFDGAVEEQRG
jgi:hypothetical protein